MAVPVGGIRARLVHDSFQQCLHDALVYLDWFNPARSHAPLRYLTEPLGHDEPVQHNALVVTTRERQPTSPEVGSDLTADDILLGIDLYLESDALASDLCNDIRDALRGRLPAGALRATFNIYDYRDATPPVVGYAQIIGVRATRIPNRFGQDSLSRHWFGVDIDVVDHYYDASETSP